MRTYSTNIKHIIALVLLLTASAAAFSARPYSVDPDNLPYTAQRFIRANFYTCVPVEAVRIGGEYHVFMNDNTTAYFDLAGNWKKVNCIEGVPEKIVPLNIRIYLATKFRNRTVIWIRKYKNSYRLELSNGYRLLFTKNGKLLKVE